MAATVRYDAYLEESDQWTLQRAQSSQLPAHRIAVGDDADTYYYVSEGLRAGLDTIRQHYEPKDIDVQQFRGQLYMTANRPLTDHGPRVDRGQRGAAGGEYRMVWLANPEQGTFTKFENADIDQIPDRVMPGVPVQDRMWLTEYDNYYRSRENIRPLPVLRIRYLDEERTWLYFDPHRGTITQQQRLSRLNRWLYAGLHEFDFPFLYNSRPLWDIVVIALSIGGIIVSGSTLWPMLLRLGRHVRRLVRSVGRVGARQPEREAQLDSLRS